MAVRATRVAVLLACLPLAGCGTVANLANSRPWDGGRTPFGGVRRDLAWVDGSANGDGACGTAPKPECGPYRQVGLTLLGAADLPLSFIGDVVTWPYTAAFTWINTPVPLATVAPAPPPSVTPVAPPPATQAPSEAQPTTSPPGMPQVPGKLPQQF